MAPMAVRSAHRSRPSPHRQCQPSGIPNPNPSCIHALPTCDVQQALPPQNPTPPSPTLPSFPPTQRNLCTFRAAEIYGHCRIYRQRCRFLRQIAQSPLQRPPCKPQLQQRSAALSVAATCKPLPLPLPPSTHIHTHTHMWLYKRVWTKCSLINACDSWSNWPHGFELMTISCTGCREKQCTRIYSPKLLTTMSEFDVQILQYWSMQ